MLVPGDQVHHYLVEARVGGGGMATVYRVRHAILQHALALKLLDPKWVDHHDVRRRFIAEGQIQALVRHPAIVMVSDAVMDAPLRIAGLVMEYVEGPNLGELVARLPGPPEAALIRSILVPVLEAVHHAHGEGVIHRDLKPANVLLSRDAAGVWRPRVADFGIAHVREEAQRLHHLRLTDPYGRLGTPAFMAPEQIAGEVPTPAVDVFALGCVLYELATGGAHPFERDTDEGTLAAIRAGVYPDPRAKAPDLDPGVEAAIHAALVVDPARRAPDCAALLELLDARAPAPAPAPARPPDPSTPIPPSFLETTGPAHERKAWRLAQPRVRIGREGVEVALGPVAHLEAHHCTLVWEGTAWVLHDASEGGTRVNGARAAQIRLEDGDLIRVGHQVLKFHARPVAPPTEGSPAEGSPAEGPPAQGSPAEGSPAEGSPAEAPPAETRPTGPHLEVARRHLHGPGPDPLRVPITPDGLVIGRGEHADLRLSEPTAAGRHCRISLQGLDVIVEDLGSAVGTRVDGLAVRFRRLADGATVRVGHAELRFRAR